MSLKPTSTLVESLEVGAVVGNTYRIESRIGSGGMGIVFRAQHLVLERPCAIKLMRDASGSAERFLREARAAQSLRSPHIVAVHDVGIEQGALYIVMELLQGESLTQTLERGPLPALTAAAYVAQACRGLQAAHQAGIVHRDVKPSNLFVCRRGGEDVIKLLDFGISKALYGEVCDDLTDTRALLGSPHYMSPEQLRDPSRVDERTDIWSVGVTLYQLLTGSRPFAGNTLTDIAVRIATEDPEPLAAETLGLADGLAELVMTALSKRPEQRPRSAEQLAEALEALAFSGLERGSAASFTSKGLGFSPSQADLGTAELGEATQSASGRASFRRPVDAGEEPRSKRAPFPRGRWVAAAGVALLGTTLVSVAARKSDAPALAGTPPPSENRSSSSASATPRSPMAPLEPGVQTQGPAPKPKAPSIRVRRKSGQKAVPSASAAVVALPSTRPIPPRPVDIDGIPIIE